MDSSFFMCAWRRQASLFFGLLVVSFVRTSVARYLAIWADLLADISVRFRATGARVAESLTHPSDHAEWPGLNGLQDGTQSRM